MENKSTHVIKNSIFALKTVFRYAPIIAAIYALLALTSSVFTVVQILFLEHLVNHVTAYISEPSELYSVLLWGTLYVVSLFGAQAYSFTLSKLGKYLNRRLTKSLSLAIINKFSRIDYHYYENAMFKDVMSRMTANPQQTIHDTFLFVINCVSHVAKLVGMLGVFFRASLWIGLGAAFIGIPMSILNVRATVRQQRLLKETTSDQRMGEYLQNLFSDKHSAYEIKIFRAKDHVLDIWHEVMKRIFDCYLKITKVLLRAQSIIWHLAIFQNSTAMGIFARH